MEKSININYVFIVLVTIFSVWLESQTLIVISYILNSIVLLCMLLSFWIINMTKLVPKFHKLNWGMYLFNLVFHTASVLTLIYLGDKKLSALICFNYILSLILIYLLRKKWINI